MDIKITPSILSGVLHAPPSKSAAHRAAICAALSKGESILSPIEATSDMLATINAVTALGANANLKEGVLNITGILSPKTGVNVECNESGSTLRFIVPIASALGISASFYGKGRLPHRPMTDLIVALQENGINIGKNGDEILSVSGKLRPGSYKIRGDVSSQYITGLLFALPLLDGGSEILLTTPLESHGYVDMTIAMQKQFGVDINAMKTGYQIPGDQKYISQNMAIEGDYSGAAFWLCAAALGGEITVSGLCHESKQSDKEIMNLLKNYGADVSLAKNAVTVRKNNCKGICIDASQIPDLIPVLAVIAAFADGKTKIYNAGRLRLKESDRLKTVTNGLTAMGADIEEFDEGLSICGTGCLLGGVDVDSCGDHRIAMALSVAAAYSKKPTVIRNAQCVDKSYPDFYNHFNMMGGKTDVL